MTSTTFDSIFATRLPPLLRQDLKQILLGHFANFGHILRISCITVKGEVRAHLQFLSEDQARNAKQHGTAFRGHTISIALTSKHPSTQVLSTAPVPHSSTLLNLIIQQPPTPVATTTNKPISSYFANAPGSSASAKLGGQVNKDVRPIPLPPPPAAHENATNVTSSAPCPSPIAHFSGAQGQRNSSVREEKPNTCLKIEVYTGGPSTAPTVQPPPQNISSTVSSTTVNDTRQPFGQIQNPGRVPTTTQRRPVRYKSLQEILNLDVSKMKVIDVISPSDALACQYFSGSNFPFPVGMMFGRTPGSVIMPTKSLMESIKPGMEICDATVEAVWNSIFNGAAKPVIKLSAQKCLSQEKAIQKVVPEWHEHFIEECVNDFIMCAAEDEFDTEENIMIECEDVVADIVHFVCNDFIESSSKSEFHVAEMMIEAAESSYMKLEENVVSKCVNESAQQEFLTDNCQEAIEELFASDFFDGCVRILARDSLEKCKVEEAKVRKKQVLNEQCEEAVEELLDSDFIDGCVRVLAEKSIDRFPFGEAFLTSYRSKVETSTYQARIGLDQTLLDRDRRTESWIQELPSADSLSDQTPEDDEYDDYGTNATESQSPPSYNRSSQQALASQSQLNSSQRSISVASSDSNMDDPSPLRLSLQPEGSRGFFGSLKRKAVSFYNSLTFKRSRRD